jgi:hypothetical protein
MSFVSLYHQSAWNVKGFLLLCVAVFLSSTPSLAWMPTSQRLPSRIPPSLSLLSQRDMILYSSSPSPMRLSMSQSKTFRSSRLYSTKSNKDDDNDDDDDANYESVPAELVDSQSTRSSPRKVTFLRRIRTFGKRNDNNNEDGNFRQQLVKMGLAAGLSYGFVSNMSYCVTVSIAWYIAGKRVRNAVN